MTSRKFRCPKCGENFEDVSYESGLAKHHLKCKRSEEALTNRDKEYAAKAKIRRETKKAMNENPEFFYSKSSKGAAAELIVAADLMKKGFHVFRSLSPTCPCDLVVMDDNGRVSRVEVKSSKPSWVSEYKSDIVAVFNEKKITYYSSTAFSTGDLVEIMTSEF